MAQTMLLNVMGWINFRKETKQFKLVFDDSPNLGYNPQAR